MPPWLTNNDANFSFAIIFATAIGATILGLVGVSNSAPARSHSTTKFWNEILARYQITCLAFLVTLIRVGQFTQEGKRLKDTLMPSLMLIFSIWLFSQKQVNQQDEKIKKRHICTVINSEVCTMQLNVSDILSVLWINSLLAFVTSVLMLIYIFNPYLY